MGLEKTDLASKEVAKFLGKLSSQPYKQKRFFCAQVKCVHILSQSGCKVFLFKVAVKFLFWQIVGLCSELKRC